MTYNVFGGTLNLAQSNLRRHDILGSAAAVAATYLSDVHATGLR